MSLHNWIIEWRWRLVGFLIALLPKIAPESTCRKQLLLGLDDLRMRLKVRCCYLPFFNRNDWREP